jgi:hypothetical protein
MLWWPRPADRLDVWASLWVRLPDFALGLQRCHKVRPGHTRRQGDAVGDRSGQFGIVEVRHCACGDGDSRRRARRPLHDTQQRDQRPAAVQLEKVLRLDPDGPLTCLLHEVIRRQESVLGERQRKIQELQWKHSMLQRSPPRHGQPHAPRPLRRSRKLLVSVDLERPLPSFRARSHGRTADGRSRRPDRLWRSGP